MGEARESHTFEDTIPHRACIRSTGHDGGRSAVTDDWYCSSMGQDRAEEPWLQHVPLPDVGSCRVRCVHLVEIMLHKDHKAWNSPSISANRAHRRAFSMDSAWKNQLRDDDF